MNSEELNAMADKVIALVQHAIDTGKAGTDVEVTATGITYDILRAVKVI